MTVQTSRSPRRPEGAAPSAVEIRGLVKTFGRTRALDGLDMSVSPGNIAGFLGPNGSVKSTTIRVSARIAARRRRRDAPARR